MPCLLDRREFLKFTGTAALGFVCPSSLGRDRFLDVKQGLPSQETLNNPILIIDRACKVLSRLKGLTPTQMAFVSNFSPDSSDPVVLGNRKMVEIAFGSADLGGFGWGKYVSDIIAKIEREEIRSAFGSYRPWWIFKDINDKLSSRKEYSVFSTENEWADLVLIATSAGFAVQAGDSYPLQKEAFIKRPSDSENVIAQVQSSAVRRILHIYDSCYPLGLKGIRQIAFGLHDTDSAYLDVKKGELNLGYFTLDDYGLLCLIHELYHKLDTQRGEPSDFFTSFLPPDIFDLLSETSDLLADFYKNLDGLAPAQVERIFSGFLPLTAFRVNALSTLMPIESEINYLIYINQFVQGSEGKKILAKIGMDAGFFARNVSSIKILKNIKAGVASYKDMLPLSVKKDFFFCFYFLRRMQNYSLLEPDSECEFVYKMLKPIIEDGLLHATNSFGPYLISPYAWTLRVSPDEQLAKLERQFKNIDPGIFSLCHSYGSHLVELQRTKAKAFGAERLGLSDLNDVYKLFGDVALGRK